MQSTDIDVTETPLTEEDLVKLTELRGELNRQPRERHRLIPLLQMVQAKLGFLPEPAVLMVADHLGLGASDVYGVATFYNQFRFTPPGRHPIRVCLGTACHVKGGDIILESAPGENN